MEMLVVDGAPVVIGATGMESLLQNIRIIILTTMYSVPLDRGFAHVGDALDSPSPHMTALLVSRLIDAIELKEPRVTVESITLEPVAVAVSGASPLTDSDSSFSEPNSALTGAVLIRKARGLANGLSDSLQGRYAPRVVFHLREGVTL